MMATYEIADKTALFQEMLSCCHKLILSCYDSSFYRLGPEGEEEKTADALFALSRQGLDLEAAIVSGAAPLLFTNKVNMMWACSPEYEQDALRHIYVLGPFFMDDFSIWSICRELAAAGASPALCRSAEALIRELPVLSWGRIQEYTLMLHYLVTGKKIRHSDLHFFSRGQPTSAHNTELTFNDTHGTYQAELEMLRMVREGDAELVKHIDRIGVTGTMGQLAKAGDSLRQMKNALFVCITLFSRAAIEGGLSPETSYTLCDRYFQNVEAASSLSELTSIASTLQREFVERVHTVRTLKLSREIESACSYIERHLEDDLSIPALADHAGYMEYYFSKKFKREVGMTVIEYIRKKRLEKAALLLRSTSLDIQQIAMRLQFCSQSYFTDCFRKKYGVSPTQYRKEGIT